MSNCTCEIEDGELVGTLSCPMHKYDYQEDIDNTEVAKAYKQYNKAEIIGALDSFDTDVVYSDYESIKFWDDDGFCLVVHPMTPVSDLRIDMTADTVEVALSIEDDHMGIVQHKHTGRGSIVITELGKEASAQYYGKNINHWQGDQGLIERFGVSRMKSFRKRVKQERKAIKNVMVS